MNVPNKIVDPELEVANNHYVFRATDVKADTVPPEIGILVGGKFSELGIDAVSET